MSEELYQAAKNLLDCVESDTDGCRYFYPKGVELKELEKAVEKIEDTRTKVNPTTVILTVTLRDEEHNIDVVGCKFTSFAPSVIGIMDKSNAKEFAHNIANTLCGVPIREVINKFIKPSPSE